MIVSSPHSGQIYPPCLLEKAGLHAHQLRRLEDAFVDRLVDMAPMHGAPLLRARFARAFVDPNREAWEVDPELLCEPPPPHANCQSAKARAGLGTVPSRIAGQAIYRQRLSLHEVERRVDMAYWPYHHALQRLISEAQSRFGQALLVDCHSMPSFTANGALSANGGLRHLAGASGMIDIALGDRFGQSCAPAIIRHAESFLGAHGLRVNRNRPYAGGHITAHYGQPQVGVHALQIEIRRGLYMDENTLRLHSSIEKLKTILGGLLASLAGLMSESAQPACTKALPAE